MKRLTCCLLSLLPLFSIAEDFATEGKKYSDLAGDSLNAVHILSEGLQTQNKKWFTGHESVLSVEYLGSERTQVNTLEVVAAFRNRSGTPATIEIRTLFLGDGGRPINDESAWQRVFLDANGNATYREVSMKTGAVKHYRLEVRESN